MTRLRIAIVEDEPINCKLIQQMLESAGYTVSDTASSYDEARINFEQNQPDMVLVDINLGGAADGIELGKYIRSKNSIPFIFITADIQRETIARAKLVEPDGFLVKPFTQVQLYSTIEIAIHNFKSKQVAPVGHSTMQDKSDLLFLKDGTVFHRIYSDDLFYAESDANYVALHLADGRKLMIRMTMMDFCEQVLSSSFIRVHRSYVVNRKYVQKIDSAEITVNHTRLPLSKTYREEVMRFMGSPS